MDIGRMIFYNYMGRYGDVTMFVIGLLGIGLMIVTGYFLYKAFKKQ